MKWILWPLSAIVFANGTIAGALGAWRNAAILFALSAIMLVWYGAKPARMPDRLPHSKGDSDRIKRLSDAVWNYLGIATAEDFVAWYGRARALSSQDDASSGAEYGSRPIDPREVFP